MPFKVKEVQQTPNPNAMKFILDHAICEGALSFFNRESAKGYPMAERLFAIPNIASLLFLEDFVTVNKTPAASWKPITAAVKKALSS